MCKLYGWVKNNAIDYTEPSRPCDLFPSVSSAIVIIILIPLYVYVMHLFKLWFVEHFHHMVLPSRDTTNIIIHVLENINISSIYANLHYRKSWFEKLHDLNVKQVYQACSKIHPNAKLGLGWPPVFDPFVSHEWIINLIVGIWKSDVLHVVHRSSIDTFLHSEYDQPVKRDDIAYVKRHNKIIVKTTHVNTYNRV